MVNHSDHSDSQEENLEKLKAEYEKLQKKYSLPSFDEIDKEFEIRKIDFDLFIVKEVRRMMMGKLDLMSSLFEPILNPSQSSLHSFIETKVFAKHNIEPMFNFYKRVWHLMHKGIYASYTSEEAEAQWINSVWKEWPGIKKEAAGYSKELADGWAKVEKDVFSDKYLQ